MGAEFRTVLGAGAALGFYALACFFVCRSLDSRAYWSEPSALCSVLTLGAIVWTLANRPALRGPATPLASMSGLARDVMMAAIVAGVMASLASDLLVKPHAWHPPRWLVVAADLPVSAANVVIPQGWQDGLASRVRPGCFPPSRTWVAEQFLREAFVVYFGFLVGFRLLVSVMGWMATGPPRHRPDAQLAGGKG